MPRTTPGPRPPRRLAIGPFTVRVDQSRAAQDRIERDSDGPLYGMWDGKNARILLTAKAADTIVRETLLHELLHTILELSGASHVHIKDKDEEEGIVRSLTPMLLDTLRRNPRLVTYLLS